MSKKELLKFAKFVLQFLGAIEQPKSHRAAKVDKIVSLLNEHQQRATYGAVKDLVGGIARAAMKSRPHTPENSWVVTKKTGLPSNYKDHQLHPNLKARKRILTTGEELLVWLRDPH